MKRYSSLPALGTIAAMHQQAGGLALSATDLSNFLSCRFHTALDLTVALGLRKKPAVFENASAEALAQRGLISFNRTSKREPIQRACLNTKTTHANWCPMRLRRRLLVLFLFAAVACGARNNGSVTRDECGRAYQTIVSVCGGDAGVNQMWNGQTAGQLGLTAETQCQRIVEALGDRCPSEYRSYFECTLSRAERAGIAICTGSSIDGCQSELASLASCEGASVRDAGVANDALADATLECRSDGSGSCVVEEAGRALLRSNGDACARRAGPYSTTPTGVFPPFELPRCDGTPYSFFNQEYCDSRATLTMLAASSCEPCRAEAQTMQRLYVRRFELCGLRVVQVLLQDNNGGEVSAGTCTDWVNQYGLTNPVLRDQRNTLTPLFSRNSLPASLLIDAVGRVAYRQSGISETILLSQIRAELTRAGANLATCERP